MKKIISVVFSLFITLFCAQKQAYLCKTETIGNFYLYLEKNTPNKTFVAYTNPKLIPNNLTFFKKVLFEILRKGNNKGSVFKINEGKIISDSLIGDGKSYFGNSKIKAKINFDNNIEGIIITGKNKIDFVANPVYDDKRHLNDYKKIYFNIEEQLKNNIYNPNILKEKEWRKFFRMLKKSMFKSKDDIDFFTSFTIQGSYLKTSHVYLLPKSDQKNNNIKPKFNFSELNSKVSFIKFNGFSINDIEAINSTILNIKTPNLIIDLRNCSGGDFSSIILASHFIREEKNVGYFLGNKYYEKNKNLPTNDELSRTKPFRGKTVTDLYNAIKDEGIVKAMAKPVLPFYEGKVYVLTNRNTASACEPLVDFLKVNNLATIIGEKTAGKMLSSKGFIVNDKYDLYLPIGNYYTTNNFWIEQNGVTPNVEVKLEDALKKALELIDR